MLLRLTTLFLIIGCALALPAVRVRQTQGNSTCDAGKTAQLIGGIEENMFIQKQELTGLQTLKSLSTAAPANSTQSNFQLTQSGVAATQQKAIAVRERNQRLADELSSPSAMGLALVAQSQAAVMIDMKSLTGGGERDASMLDGLVKRVMDAMAQNGANLKVVDGACRR
ncbi:hypothetical protein EJ07DRAFT_138344 [Lizonia empirigonia]|nr:hypothetical protein EJ07DRAFT_138344 [Lizonia empirigonia]